jgi:hypothetical protein
VTWSKALDSLKLERTPGVHQYVDVLEFSKSGVSDLQGKLKLDASMPVSQFPLIDLFIE